MTEATPIERYLARLGSALRGPRATKRDLLVEARDALVDATQAYTSQGPDREVGERRAVAEFGDLETIASAYQAELGLTQARRTSL